MFQHYLSLLLIGIAFGLPQRYRIPDFQLTSPEEINSLELQSRSIDLKPSTKNRDVEATIKEVEAILKSDPSLPRLTRGEILDLLENITENDSKSKLRDPKAIMVVMPFTPTNYDEKSLEELYTRRPVTQIIGAEPFKVNKEDEKGQNNKPSRRRPPAKFNEINKIEDYSSSSSSTTTTEKGKTSPITSRSNSRRRRPTSTTETPPISSTRRPSRRRSTTTSSPPTQHPHHRYPEETSTAKSVEFSVNEGLKIIDPPKLKIRNQEEDIFQQQNSQKEYVINHDPPKSASLVSTITPLMDDLNLPENLHKVVQDLDLNTAIDPEKSKKPTLEEQNRVKELLASIGAVDLPTTSRTTTTQSLEQDVTNVAENLSPDMRDLLMNFGLIPDPKQKSVKPDVAEYNPEKAEVSPDSYVGFKPLPEDNASRDDMETLLASFGLGRGSRKEKSVKDVKEKKKQEELNLDVVPDGMKDVLKDLGLNHRQEKKIRTPPVQKNQDKQHVFNPDSQYATEEELKKLEKLLGMIKKLEKLNGTATDEDLKKIDIDGLKELVESFNGNNTENIVPLNEKHGNLDPLKYNIGPEKNEIKREQSSTSTTSTTTTTTTTTTTEEPRMPAIGDLEASFGGQTEVTESPPPPPKKTGFYYLLDWNTFLDIDDQKGKRVNLRFQPKVGDPKRFYAVTVP